MHFNIQVSTYLEITPTFMSASHAVQTMCGDYSFDLSSLTILMGIKADQNLLLDDHAINN